MDHRDDRGAFSAKKRGLGDSNDRGASPQGLVQTGAKPGPFPGREPHVPIDDDHIGGGLQEAKHREQAG